MNSQSNAMNELLTTDSQAVAPTVMNARRSFYWSIRRELWEYRSIYIAPLAVASVSLFGFLVATIGRALASAKPEQRFTVLAEPYKFAVALPMLAAMLIGAYYCLDTFPSERRDRSIFFWKSLPVSDLTTVLAKATVMFVILPLIVCSLMVILEVAMVSLSSLVVSASGLNLTTFWTKVAPFQFLLLMLYHMITIHLLWHAPFYGWMMLVSSWARRAAILWAALPPLAIGLFEMIAFHTTHFGHFMMYRLSGGPEAVPMGDPFDPMTHLTPGRFLTSPGLWLGLLFTTLCLAGAVRLRRYRGPI
jgi:ABC-2 type transport system permease protein